MNIYYAILVHVVWFLSTYFVVVFMLALFYNRKKLYDSPEFRKNDKLPKISIIVPAYNEEESIADCIKSLKLIDYPKSLFEVIIVNDGSIDRTADIVREHTGKNIILVDNSKNKGKAKSLNQGISLAKGSYIACMDADTIVPSDILRKTLPYFKDEKVGSVTVSVEVRSAKNFLQRIIRLEYILGLSLFLKIFSLFNCVHVTPGPFSVYRKRLLDKIGYFDPENITEDLEIAYRIHKSGYKIANCMSTAVHTVTPHDMKGLYRQRRRWYSGALLTLWQHKDILAKNKTGLFGYFIPFNYALIASGLGLFVFSTYLLFSNIFRNLSYYSLTNYNFFSNMTFDFDLLAVSMFLFFGLSGILGMILLVTYSLGIARSSLERKPSLYFGYFILFFMYQAFWLASFFIVLMRRKVRW
ncbi:glycosyltransferase family 2 protein [Candidatus Woesearchaeota archaeon]|nr:glycosyltransferase family 2 protein [Candidatus Woesearchaeota archaeon]